MKRYYHFLNEFKFIVEGIFRKEVFKDGRFKDVYRITLFTGGRK